MLEYNNAEYDEDGFEVFAINNKRFKITEVEHVVAKPVEWWKDQLIPKNTVTILAGYGGCGKSTAAIGWAAEETRNGGKVLYLHAEGDRQRTLKPQFDVLGVTSGVKFVDATGDTLTLPDDLDALTYLVENHDISFVVFDAITSFSADGVSHNQPSEVRRYLEPIVQWAEHNEVTVLGIAHFGKGAVGGSNKIAGARTWVDVPRSALTFAIADDTGEGVMTLAKSNCAYRRPNVSYRIDSVDRTIMGVDTRVSFIEWGEETSVTVDQVLADNEDRGKRTAAGVERADAWLARVLANGPMLAEDVERLNRDRGVDAYSVSQLRTGREKVADSGKSPEFQGRWWWRLSGAGHPWPWDRSVKDAI